MHRTKPSSANGRSACAADENARGSLTRREFVRLGLAGTAAMAGGSLARLSDAAGSPGASASAGGPVAGGQVLAAVKPVGGVPTLVVDGKPCGPLAITRCAWSFEQLAKTADLGFPLHFEMVGDVGWPGEQEETFRRLDARLRKVLDAVPRARVVLRLYLCKPPAHFLHDYPDEVLRFNDGSTQRFTKWYAMSDRAPEDRGYPSFASEVWRRNTAEALAQYVAHVRQAPYAGNVIGYFICGGGTEEWYYWGDYDHEHYCVDFSPAMLKKLRAHLREKYPDVAALRAAWHDPAVDFDNALPHGPRGWRNDTGAFWEPAKLQHARDYSWVQSQAMADSILLFARAVKDACRREQVVGLFYGSLQNYWPLETGQEVFKGVLNSPDIDFWASPPQYDRRGPGEQGCFRSLGATLKRHGKLWFSEADFRTSFMGHAANPSMRSRPPADVTEDLAVLQREFAHEVCEGANGWWFPMGPDWYVQEPIQALFGQIQRLSEAALDFDRTADTDIAAVVDMESVFVAPSFTVTLPLLDSFKVQELPRIGAPVDYYELADILAPDARPYKLYVFLNCFSLDDEERRLIDRRLRRSGATLVWMYAPGLFRPGRQPEMSPAHVRDLLGFGLDSEAGTPMKLNMKLTAEGVRFCEGFDPGRAFGGFERPRWMVNAAGQGSENAPEPTTQRQRLFGAEGGVVLARFEEGGRPSIVMRQTAAATDLWIGSVMAPADLLRSLARRAGCHLFCDADEIVYANKSFLALHTAAAGERTFRLRRPADVVEMFSGEVLGRGVTTFRDRADARRTRLYFLGDRARWQASLKRADGALAQFQEQLKAGRKARAEAARL